MGRRAVGMQPVSQQIINLHQMRWPVSNQARSNTALTEDYLALHQLTQ
jgi:hypothetical protein